MQDGSIHTDHRIIATEIPHPGVAQIQSRLSKVEARSMHGQLPVIWDRAEGHSVYDPWGNKWIDFTSTIFVANAGHANRQVIRAITETARKPLLHAYNYITQERLEYLEALADALPRGLDKSFLVSAGTEAVEVALKLLRLDAMHKGKRRGVVFAFEGNWHGRTVGAQLLGDSIQQKAWIGFDDSDIVHLPFPYPWTPGVEVDPRGFLRLAYERKLDELGLDPKLDVAGFVLETYQGWGAFFYPQLFVEEVSAICAEGNALLCFDEMQAGFGRTGRLFGYEHYGVAPDLICCGKGVSSSLPLAFVAGKSEIMDLPEIGSMSSTHSANPLSCVAGLANLRALQEGRLVERAERLGNQFHDALREIQSRSRSVRYVEGRGMVAALIFADLGTRSGSEVATAVAWEAMRRGLLVVHTGRESVKLAPPLVIEESALSEGLQVLDETIAHLEGRGDA